MKKHDKQAAIRASQMLISANLSESGRDASVRIAAHLQYADGFFHDYLNAMVEAVESAPVEKTLPLLLEEGWIRMSSTQQRQWIVAVKQEMAATLAFVRQFQTALAAQASMIEDEANLHVEAETARLAKDEPFNQQQADDTQRDQEEGSEMA